MHTHARNRRRLLRTKSSLGDTRSALEGCCSHCRSRCIQPSGGAGHRVGATDARQPPRPQHLLQEENPVILRDAVGLRASSLEMQLDFLCSSFTITLESVELMDARHIWKIL